LSLVLQVFSGSIPAIASVPGFGGTKEEVALQSASVFQKPTNLTPSQNEPPIVMESTTEQFNQTGGANHFDDGTADIVPPSSVSSGSTSQAISPQTSCSVDQSVPADSALNVSVSSQAMSLSGSATNLSLSKACHSFTYPSLSDKEADIVTSHLVFAEPVVTLSTGSLTIYVQNVNGAYMANVEVVLYNVNYAVVGTAYTNSNGYVTFSNIGYGTYYMEAYYPSPAPLGFTEFWGSGQISIAAASTTYYFMRNTQYCSQITANSQVVPGTDVEVNPGDNVQITVTVTSKQSVPINSEVDLYLDQSKSSPYDYHQMSSSVTVPAQGTGQVSWNWNTLIYGTYFGYVVVYGYYNGRYIVTDQYPWFIAFYVRYPDLTWTRIWTSPSSPTGGQTARIYCELKNQGTGNWPSVSFTNYFYIDGVYDSQGTNTNGIAAGAVFDWYFDRTLSPGYHTITASADVNNNVPESNEGNNQLTQKLWWSGPDLIVTSIWWVDSYGTTNGAITSGQPFNIYFTIKNAGDASAGASYAYLTVGTVDSASYNIPALGVGATQSCQLLSEVVSSTPSVTLTVTADYTNTVAEANQNTGSGNGNAESNNQATVSVPIQKAKWTIIVYFAADNNLEGTRIDKFNQLAQIGATSSVSIVAQMDRIPGYDSRYGDWTDAKRFYISKGMTLDPSNALQDLGETDTGDPNTLSGFANWAIDRYQADHYLLVISDHGDSWAGTSFDDTSGTHLSISGIKTAFFSISSHLGKHVDIVWFDDCLMSSLEIAYQIDGYADYLVSSETSNYPNTWDFNGVNSYLSGNPTVSSQALAIQLVNMGNLQDDAATRTQSNSAIDLSRVTPLVTTVSSLAGLLRTHMHQWQSQIGNARSMTSWFEGPFTGDTQKLVDLKQLCSNLKSSLSDSTAQGLAQSVMDQIGPSNGAVGYVVIREAHTQTSASFCNGISIYFPDTSADYGSSYIIGNDFTSNTLWDEFVTDYYNPLNTPPTIAINAPTSGSAWSGMQTVIWTGADGDYDSVSYALYVSTNGGSTWGLLTSSSFQENPSPTTHSAQLDTTKYTDTTQCLMRIDYDDNHGGTGSLISAKFTMDNTGPVTGIVHFAGAAAISLTANDVTSGVSTSYYRIDGGSWNIYSSVVSIPPGGTHTFDAYSTDNAGNSGPVVHLTVYLLTISTNYGSTTPTNGYYDSGTSIQISSTASGYSWNGWTGSGSGSYTGMNNPASITFNGPITETASWTAPPPPGWIGGVVTDSSNKGIASATVSYSGPASGSVSTDGNGNYVTPDLPPGSYSVTASMTGYVSRTSSAKVSSGTTTTLNLQLQQSAMAVRGLNNGIYYRVWNGAAWGDWMALAGLTIDSPAAAVVGNQLHLVVRGVNYDQIWYGSVNLADNSFSGWTQLSGATPSAPTLTANSTTLCLVVRGETNWVYYRFYDIASKTWGDWSGIVSGSTSDSPGATLVNDQLNLVVQGVNYGQIWYGSLNLANNSFSGWTQLSGATPSAPTLTS
jgi:hypothetical protein